MDTRKGHAVRRLVDGNSYVLPLEFVQLWDKIRHRTRDKVTVDTPKLINDLAKLQYANEPRKIRSGYAHFNELRVDFATVKNAGEVRPNKLV